MKKVLQEKLYDTKLASSVVESHSYDLLEHKIVMTCRVVTSDKVTKHTLEFLRIATAYHVNGSDEDSRKYMPPFDGEGLLQLDDIVVVEAPLEIEVECDAPGWEDGCKGGGNICLEMYDATFVLEAAEVRVDGESFVIGDW